MKKCGSPVCFLPDRKKKVNISAVLSASIYLTIQDQHETNFPVNVSQKKPKVRGDRYTLNGPSIHWNPLTKRINPREKWLTSHKERIWKNIWSMWELRIPPHVQNTLSLQYTWGKKTQKRKTIETMYASCYTERHSVWYVVYYCKHILTDICYRVERKRSTLSSNGNSFM